MAKSTLSAKISNCTISLGLDKRHSKSNLYPVCIRYSFNGKFMYYPIGDQCTEKEFKQIIETESTREGHPNQGNRMQISKRNGRKFLKHIENGSKNLQPRHF